MNRKTMRSEEGKKEQYNVAHYHEYFLFSQDYFLLFPESSQSFT